MLYSHKTGSTLKIRNYYEKINMKNYAFFAIQYCKKQMSQCVWIVILLRVDYKWMKYFTCIFLEIRIKTRNATRDRHSTWRSCICNWNFIISQLIFFGRCCPFTGQTLSRVRVGHCPVHGQYCSNRSWKVIKVQLCKNERGCVCLAVRFVWRVLLTLAR